MREHDWNHELRFAESEQTGGLMSEIVSIVRAGHQRIVTRMCRPERLMRQNGCPLGIRLWADQPVSYSTWRERTRDRAYCERVGGPGKW